jgi:hypothetical protein
MEKPMNKNNDQLNEVIIQGEAEDQNVIDKETYLVEEFKANFKPEIFKSRLAIALKYSGRSRDEIKTDIAITTSMISNYLNSPTIVPSFRTLKKLSNYLGVDYNWLIGIEDADIEGFKRFNFISASRGVSVRSKQLAKLVATHIHQDQSALPMIDSLLRDMVYLNKQQLNQLSIFAQGLTNSTFQSDEVVSNRVLYNAYSLDPEKSLESDYNDLLLLNKLTQEFKPNQLELETYITIKPSAVHELIKNFDYLKTDKQTVYDFELFYDMIKNRVESHEFQDQYMTQRKQRDKNRSIKKITEK